MQPDKIKKDDENLADKEIELIDSLTEKTIKNKDFIKEEEMNKLLLE